jgi:hypothetical protein
MLAISARRRPARSAMMPKRMPPSPEANRVSEPRKPATLVEIEKSLSSAPTTMAYSITSNASSIQPSEAPSSARRAAGVPSFSHAKGRHVAAGSARGAAVTSATGPPGTMMRMPLESTS